MPGDDSAVVTLGCVFIFRYCYACPVFYPCSKLLRELHRRAKGTPSKGHLWASAQFTASRGHTMHASVVLLAPLCHAYTLCASSSLPRRIAASATLPGSTADRPPRMSEAWFVATADLSADPYAIIGVKRGADIAEIKRAYRARARELHPDTRSVASAENGTEDGTEGSADRFSALVGAYQHLARLDSTGRGLVPGSAETHPLWDRLPDFYHHW